MKSIRHWILGACTLGLILALAPAGAQSDYPARTIRLIVPFSAGFAADTVGRAMADELAKQIAVPVVIENRQGAGAFARGEGGGLLRRRRDDAGPGVENLASSAS